MTDTHKRILVSEYLRLCSMMVMEALASKQELEYEDDLNSGYWIKCRDFVQQNKNRYIDDE